MDLRKVRAEEATSVQQILVENGQWMLSKGIDQWPIEWLESIADDISTSVSEGRFWCFDSDDEIVAVVEVRHDPEQLWGLDTEPSSYVHKLAINRSHHSSSLGSKLLGAVIERARLQKRRYVRLDCVASNERLRSYYENQGFRFVRIATNGEIDLALYELALAAPQ